jgi:hypothetical protein
MSASFRDIAIPTIGVLAALFLSMVLRLIVPDRWDALLHIALPLATLAAIKAFVPTHAILERVSWIYLLASAFILMVAAYVFGDPAIFWLWKIPLLILIGLGWCVVHLLYGPPEKGDEGNASR